MIYVLQVELSKEKIASLREKIERKNSVFKDKRYLDSLFLPSKIIGREKQAEQLIQYIDSLRQGLLVPVISVYGRSGAGKSTVIRFVCKNMSDVLSFSFVNLRKAKTVFGCSNLILSELGSENLKSAQGLNKAIDCMESKIEKILADEKKKFFVLILDEYDVIFSDPRGRPSDFVYKLLTLEENMREKGLRLCIITLSNNALSEHDLDDRVKSRIGNSDIFFEPYRQDDVFNILQDRAKKAFSKKVSVDVLRYCAKLSSYDHGDARRALDLLRIAGELSDGKKLTMVDVDKAVELLQRDRVTTIVKNSSYHMRTVIGAICAVSLISGNSWCATSAIYKKYCSILSKELKSLSYRRIVDLLVEVENSGLVVSRTISRGRQGYGNEYKLKLSPDLVGPYVSGEKWWEFTVKQKEMQDITEELNASLKSRRKSLFSTSPFRSSNLLKKYGLDL